MQGCLTKLRILFHCLLDGGQSTVSRSRVTAHFPSRGIPFQTVIWFSRGLSIDELSQVYTFLITRAVYPRGRKSARKTRYFHALGIVV